MNETRKIGVQHRRASFASNSFDSEARTIQVVWTTGAQVRRYSWSRDEEFDEELVTSPSAIRIDRLNNSAPFLADHRAHMLDAILGVVVPGSARIEKGQGTATIRLSERPEVAGIVGDIQSGVIRNVSVGYRVHRFERVAAADRKDGGTLPLMRAVDWEPLEISAVAVGADAAAQVRGEMNDLAPVIIVERKRSMDGPTTTAGPAPDGNLGSSPAADEIRTICERHGLDPAFRDQLIRDGVSLDQARTLILDRLVETDPVQRTVEPSPRNPVDQRAEYRDAMMAAIVAQVTGERNPPPRARHFIGMTFPEMAAECLRNAGLPVPSGGPGRVVEAALGRSGFGAARGVGYHSTSDFPAVLTGAFNSILRAEYGAASSGLLRTALPRDLPNFQPVTAAALGGDLRLLQVPESAEITYGTLDDSAEKIVLASYARIVALTRQALVNDHLGAFDRLPRLLATGAAETIAAVLVGLLEGGGGAGPVLADGTRLFHTNRGNLMTGAAISVASIGLAVAALRRQRGLGGEAINVQPAFLVVPPELEAVALQSVAEISPASANDANPFSGKLEVVVEPRLADAKRWYLAAAPGRPESLIAAYLDGNRGPMLDSRMGFEVDGIEFRCRLDFGAAFVDWRGWITNPGP